MFWLFLWPWRARSEEKPEKLTDQTEILADAGPRQKDQDAPQAQ
jgi:hypothetical protein